MSRTRSQWRLCSLREKKSEFYLRWILHCKTFLNTVESRVQWSCFFPDKTNSLPVARGVTQIVNSYTVNMRALFILGILLYSSLYIDSCMPWMHYLKVSIWIFSENSQLIGKKLKIPVHDIFQAFQASHYQQIHVIKVALWLRSKNMPRIIG